MKDGRLVELAILGLEAERTRIDEELASLRSRGEASPVTPGKKRMGRPRKIVAEASADVEAPTARKTRKMSAAKKKALSERMKRIWAERRKANK